MVAGVIGSPVRHSLSPLIHDLWITAAGLDAAYELVEAVPDGFADRVADVKRTMRGLNVTIPFKEEALSLADRRSPQAVRAGAANLLLFNGDGSISADNTDGVGLLAAFAEQAPGFNPRGSVVVVLGAGGAARGAAAALADTGAEVRLVNRTRTRATAIAGALRGNVRGYGWDELAVACSGADALVNATSLGLQGSEALSFDLALLPEHAVVMDMVYRPLLTPLLRQARKSGRPTVDGLAMLIGQAAPSFEAFYGVPVPEGVNVRAAVLKALGETG